MAVGWAGDNAVNDQIRDSIDDEVRRATAALPRGESLEFCEECGDAIGEARRRALPGVRRCVSCQEEVERAQERVSLYNRKAGKDSQLR